MQDTTKNKILVIGFIGILMAVFLMQILSPDKTISVAERRKLEQMPEITIEKVVNGEVMKKWETYVTDQFIARDTFREIKSFFHRNVLGQKDNNQLFEKEGAIYKMEYPLNKNNIQKTASKIRQVYETYLQENNVYYAIIPDKNYYLENDDHLKIDYQELKQIMKQELSEMEYIDIWDSLTLEDYYRTDIHWKQENLQQVVRTIQNAMGQKDTSKTEYEVEEIGEFYGVYYGQLASKVSPDILYTLTNETIANCTTYNEETKKQGKVYDKTPSADQYDIYLSGATPLITIKNPNASTEKELLLFRDSFGSSIAPLLIENYRKITLIDLRYISSQLLNNYITFDEQDVLFLYSTSILNQNVLK